MQTFNDFKTGLLDCLYMQAKNENRSQAIRDFRIGVDSVDRPDNWAQECDWITELLAQYVESGVLDIQSLSIPESLTVNFDCVGPLMEFTDVANFIQSVMIDVKASNDDFDFFMYCKQVIDQLKYLERCKCYSKKVKNNTDIAIEGVAWEPTENYLEEFKWLRNILREYSDKGAVTIDASAIPSGIISISSQSSICSHSEMMDFIGSIRLEGSTLDVNQLETDEEIE